jgi:hypothetical protein
LRSLSVFYYLLLSGSLVLFFVGYWRNHLALLLAPCVLLGILFLSFAFQVRAQVPLITSAPWLEEIALYESRIFEVLAMLAVLHLAVLAISTRPTSFRTWLTAAPQAGLIIFLYHARSSMGWQYLALFSIVAIRLTWLARERWLRKGTVSAGAFLRPFIVATLLASTIIGLGAYKRSMYHPAYFAERGPRTFWHNALIGFAYHPGLRKEHHLDHDDGLVVELVLRRMKESGDPRLDDSWTKQNILNSLGSHTEFDWVTYEQVAREIYFSFWKQQTTDTLACYFWYKPVAEVKQVYRICRLLLRTGYVKAPIVLFSTILLALVAIIAVGRGIGRHEALRTQLASYSWLGLVLLAFSAIPSMAFYAALSTMSGMYVALSICTIFWSLRTVAYIIRGKSSLGAPQIAPVFSDGFVVNVA